MDESMCCECEHFLMCLCVCLEPDHHPVFPHAAPVGLLRSAAHHRLLLHLLRSPLDQVQSHNPTQLKSDTCPWSTKAVISSTGIFVAIDNNTLNGSKLSIFLLCQKSLRSCSMKILCTFPTANISNLNF